MTTKIVEVFDAKSKILVSAEHFHPEATPEEIKTGLLSLPWMGLLQEVFFEQDSVRFYVYPQFEMAKVEDQHNG